MPVKQRIEWIDTAKGICILLVILHHTSRYIKVGYACEDDFMVFRMPLYFLLSGLFFKTYAGFFDFTIRKTNKLIIPYIFFYVMGGILLPILIFQFFDYKTWGYKEYNFEAVGCMFSEKVICNNSIWFLFCLFEVNLLFYSITISINSLRLKKQDSLKYAIILSCLVGFVGLMLSFLKKDLPFFVDSALAATPFFCAGWYLRNYTSFLTIENNKSNIIKSLLFVVFVSLLIHNIRPGYCSIHGNRYGDWQGLLQLYPYGILGTLSVLTISRIIGKVPILSYIGRYSIIVLCTHGYVIQIAYAILLPLLPNVEGSSFLLLLCVILVVALSMIIIPVLKKWLPYVTAQKDIFVLSK